MYVSGLSTRARRFGILAIAFVLVFTLIAEPDAEARKKKRKKGGGGGGRRISLRRNNNNLFNAINDFNRLLILSQLGGGAFGNGLGFGGGGNLDAFNPFGGLGAGVGGLGGLGGLGGFGNGFGGLGRFGRFGGLGGLGGFGNGLGGLGGLGGFGNGLGGLGGLGGQGLGDGAVINQPTDDGRGKRDDTVKVVAGSDGLVGTNGKGDFFELNKGAAKEGQTISAEDPTIVRQKLVAPNGQLTAIGTAGKPTDEAVAAIQRLRGEGDGAARSPSGGADMQMVSANSSPGGRPLAQ